MLRSVVRILQVLGQKLVLTMAAFFESMGILMSVHRYSVSILERLHTRSRLLGR